MALNPPTIFGKSYNTVPIATNFQGLSGWYIVPGGWFCRQNADGTITASPNSDFSSELYDVKVDADGFMKFQNLLWNAMVATG
jgi:hypothetical protein